MPVHERPPSQDELLAMAYADDELSPESRRSFEERLATDTALAREVSEYLSLAVLARQMAAPEPMDHEWRRLAGDPLHRIGHGVGWLLFVLGAVGVAGIGVFAVAMSELTVFPKVLLFSLLGGFLILLLLTVRSRLRTLPYDVYTKVER